MIDSFNGFHEGNKLEAKEAARGLPSSLWETYSAFANTDGGVILLGVKELGDGSLRVVGLPDAQRMVKLFWDGVNNPSLVSRNILASSDVEVLEADGVDVVSIRVPRAAPGDRPVYLKDNPFRYSYRRNGEGDYRCSDEEVRSMIRGAGEGLADKHVIEDAEASALSAAAVSAYRNVLASTRPRHPWNALDDEEFLIRLEAVSRSRDDGALRPTSAGLLMFGYAYRITPHFPNYFLEYREVLGTRKWDDRFTSDDGDWSGCVFDFWRKASVKLVEGLPQPYATSGLHRVEDTPMHEALREGLANMLIHADYHGVVGSSAVRYDDKVVFSNPGVPLMSAEEAMSGGLSVTRNPTLMKMFNLIAVGERAGSGFDTMRRGCEWAMAKPPALTERLAPDRTILEIGLPMRLAERVQLGLPSGGSLGEPDTLGRALALFDGGKAVTRAEVERALGIGKNAAVNVLNDLIRQGAIVKEGSARATSYRLSDLC